MENLEYLCPQILSTYSNQLNYEEPLISVSADIDKHEDCNSQAVLSPITEMNHKQPEILVANDGERNGECLEENQDLSRLFNDAGTPQSA